MHEIDHGSPLSRVDLNLLRVFAAMWEERHVGRAAQRLALSQSASSHALARLREALGDELFVRHPKGVAPTPRAVALAPAILSTLSQLRAIFTSDAPFDPARLREQVTIGATDYAALVVVSPVLAAIQKSAPGLDVRIVPVDQSTVIDAIDKGMFDLAIGNFPSAPQRFACRVLFEERFVGIVRKGHPRIDRYGRMGIKAFVETPHALVSLRGDSNGLVDDALSAQGLSRRVAMTVAHFLALPFVVAGSDMIGLMASRAAAKLSEAAGVKVFKPPLALPTWSVEILVHQQRQNTPALAWLVEQLTQ